MAKLSKEKRIKAEIDRLKAIFHNLDENKLNTVMSLIENAAFTRITLEDLQEVINVKGCVEEYQNGQNQKGYKKTTEVDVHIAMTKNLTSIMKQLTELCPADTKKESKLKALMQDE